MRLTNMGQAVLFIQEEWKAFAVWKEGNMFLTVMATDASEQNLNESTSWSRSY